MLVLFSIQLPVSQYTRTQNQEEWSEKCIITFGGDDDDMEVVVGIGPYGNGGEKL